MMTDWYQRSINALQLNGKGERTQEAYTRAVRMLSTFYSKPPDEIAAAELEAYFLRRRNVDHWSPNTMRICYCGIRFFFVHVLQRNWHLFEILRALQDVRARIELASGFVLAPSEAPGQPRVALQCRQGGGPLRFARVLLPGDTAITSFPSLGPRTGEAVALSTVPAGP